MIELNIKTNRKNEMINISYIIDEEIKKYCFTDGILTVFVPHTTAAITINENADPDVKTDIINGLEAIIPNINFRHYEGNSDGHIKSSLVGVSEQVIVKNSKLQLGTWQSLFFCEFDGPRNRKVFLNFSKNC